MRQHITQMESYSTIPSSAAAPEKEELAMKTQDGIQEWWR